MDLDNIAASLAADPVWQSGHDYSLDDLVVPSTPNGYRYRCTQAGHSGLTEPAWPAAAGETIREPADRWRPNHAYSVGEWITPTGAGPQNVYECRTAGISGATEPTWHLDNNDGTVRWHDTLQVCFPVDWLCELGQITLPAITGYPGVARAVLRAVKAGLEERNLDALELEYDAAGAFIASRPNPAGLIEATEAVVTAGGDVYHATLSLIVTYDPAREKGVATHVHLYKRSPGGSYAGSPDASGNLVSGANGLKEAALSVVFTTAGWYYVQARAATAGNVESTAADCAEYLVLAADGEPDAPAVEGQVSRG
jgi:hypothetical protein